MRRSKILITAAIIAGLGLTSNLARAQGIEPPFQPQPSQKVGDLDVLQLRANFYMIAGAGTHIGVQVGPDGAIVVNAGSAEKSDAVIAAIKRISPQPIRFIIDTGARPDEVGGNEKLAKAGQTIFNIDNNPVNFQNTNGGAAGIIGAENVLRHLSGSSGDQPALPRAAWPSDAFHEKRKYMYWNGEGIEILHQPAAVSDSDSIVFFRRSDVVVTGDILDMDHFPVIDVARGGGVQGEIDALNKLVELAIPSVPMDWRNDGTLIVPGAGRIADQYDVVEYRDMITIIRDRVRDLIKQGKTLQEVEDAAPATGYSARFGSDSGPWTTSMFVEAVYNSLSKGKAK